MRPAHKDKFLVTFWGTRGSVPTPGFHTEKYGGNTTCVEIQYNDSRVIIDAGTGIRALGSSLMQRGLADNVTLLLTHTHWDHVQGLPFFVPAYVPSSKFTILGLPPEGQKLRDVLAGVMDPVYFPVSLDMLAAELSVQSLDQREFQVGELKISWQQQWYHPGGSLRFRIEAGGRVLVFSSDVELEEMYTGTSLSAQTLARREEYESFVQGVDLLIADGQYTKAEYLKKKGWGHTSVTTLLATAHRLGVKRVGVFHHEPLYSDQKLDSLAAKFAPLYAGKERAMSIFWCRERTTLEV